MAPLDTYFYHLQRLSGAEQFILVRDDAKLSPRSMKRRRAPRSASLPSSFGSSGKSRPEFEESQPQMPPCLPLRIESQDDLCVRMDKQLHHQEKTIMISTDTDMQHNRFKSLFGADIAASIDAKYGLIHQARSVEIKALANLAAPKFPTRKGSRDDLNTSLRSSSRQMGRECLANHPATKNKLQLSLFLDEVTQVLDRREDHAQPSIEPYLNTYYGSPRNRGWVI